MNIRKTLATVLTGAVLAFGASSANAVVIYDWSGTCKPGVSSACTGTATGVLTLADTYTPGNTVLIGDFVSWSFSSNTINYTVPGIGNVSQIFFGGPLPVTSGTSGHLQLSFGAAGFFNSDYNAGSPFWDTRIPDNTNRAFGFPFTWTLRAVPEPGTLALFGLGLAGLGVMRRRKAS